MIVFSDGVVDEKDFPRISERMNSNLAPLSGRWISASHVLCDGEIGNAMDFQDIGTMDIRLSLWEVEALAGQSKGSSKDNDIWRQVELPLLMSELGALSRLWVMGLYEILRVTRGALSRKYRTSTKIFPGPYIHLDSVFYDLEVIRMPIAKHEPRKGNGIRSYPEPFFHHETGSWGWQVECLDRGKVQIVRRDLSNRFLDSVERIKAERAG